MKKTLKIASYNTVVYYEHFKCNILYSSNK